MARSDSALEAFDRLKLRVVEVEYKTAASFLARFQSAAASLGPDERIELVVGRMHDGVELLKAVLADPQADKICVLCWWYDGKEDVNSIVPLLVNNCPELASLQVEFRHHSALDFVSSVLEHPGSKITVLEVPEFAKGDLPRFFAALRQSQVSALTIFVSHREELQQGLCDYLAKDLLVRLKISMGHKPVPSELLMSLADCTCLAKLEMTWCEFFQPGAFTNLSRSITKLELRYCQFVGGFDWSFLVGSSVRELDFDELKGVDGKQLGGALAVQLRAKGLDELRFCDGDFADETLAAVGVEIGRVKRLDLKDSELDNASIELIALALQSPHSELQELELPYYNDTASSIETYLVPALRHPNCSLAKLGFGAEQTEYNEAATRMESELHNRRALFTLLQGQQVRRRYCPLRRLPVEMFRLVGDVLL